MAEPPDMRGAALDIARSDVDLSLCFLAIFDQGMNGFSANRTIGEFIAEAKP